MRCALLAVALAACGDRADVQHPGGAGPEGAPLSLAADAQMIAIRGGDFICGSTPEEREQAYDDHEHTSGSDTARREHWFDGEDDHHVVHLAPFAIDLLPVTEGQYAEFVAAGGAPAPRIDEAAWRAQGFPQDYASVVARDVWPRGQAPLGRAEHPVTLVTWQEAAAYCVWRGRLTGQKRRLPTEHEYEKASRGSEGLWYPWGNLFDAGKLDSAVKGSGDTVVVGQYPDGASAFGVLELAGNVAEWTSSRDASGGVIVKGSSFDDWAGAGRGAARHSRKPDVRHIAIGFRCATDTVPAGTPTGDEEDGDTIGS